MKNIKFSTHTSTLINHSQKKIGVPLSHKRAEYFEDSNSFSNNHICLAHLNLFSGSSSAIATDRPTYLLPLINKWHFHMRRCCHPAAGIRTAWPIKIKWSWLLLFFPHINSRYDSYIFQPSYSANIFEFRDNSKEGKGM